MSRTKLLLALVMAALAVDSVHAGPGIFRSRPKTDPTRVPALIETLKSDPDEKRRKAAADELGAADPRQNPEAAAALTATLQKDASSSVRQEAAEALGRLGQVFPVAGQALEATASGDSSPAVRLAAKRTLWEYHLSGYRSPKGADGVAMQTVEPPISSPAAPRPASAVIPVPPPPAPAAVAVKPLVPSLPPASAPGAVQAPAPSGPRVSRSFLPELFPGPRAALRSLVNPAPPLIPNVTGEPPIAKRAAVTIPLLPVPPDSEPDAELVSGLPVPPPTLAIIPEPPPAPRKPDYVSTLPPYMPELPSVVAPPDATPELAPHPTPKYTIPPTLPPVK